MFTLRLVLQCSIIATDTSQVMNESTERRRSDDFSWPVIGLGGDDVTGDVSDGEHTVEFMCMHLSARASFMVGRQN